MAGENHGRAKNCKNCDPDVKQEIGPTPWVNFEAGAAWTRDIVTILVCFKDLRKGELPKPYSSLQAVDLSSYGDDEYLAISVADHLGIEKPITRRGAAMSALGGEEFRRKRGIIAVADGRLR